MKTDVLVLGAGLAGLRAAWGALEADPGLTVHVVSLGHGPSGSSFANRNNRLGLRAPRTKAEKDETVRLAMEIAVPGFTDQSLVTTLYDEAADRLDELVRLGLSFDMDGSSLKSVPGCFGGPDTCALFNDLAGAFNIIRSHVVELGAKFTSSHEVLGLVAQDGVHGAWLGSLEDGRALCVSAGAVVMAMGGPAPLFTGHLAGPGTPGNAYALLEEAGATLENTSYLQCMWTSADKRDYHSPAQMLVPGTEVGTHANGLITLKDEPMLEFARARATHCPAAYGPSRQAEDAAMDHWLLDHADADRSLGICRPDDTCRRVYLAAHAGNGGAIIDANGSVGIPGLFACGECATGMHGANRLGGGMVAATQVFGRRAGIAAAHLARSRKLLPEREFTDICHAGINALPAQDWDDFEFFEEIGDGLQAHALYRPGPDLESFKARLKEIERTAVSRRVLLAARAALAVVGG